MIIKKILDMPIGKPAKEIRNKIDVKLKALISDINLKYLIKPSYSWYKERVLLIKSAIFPVRVVLIILDQRFKVYIELHDHFSSLLSYFEMKFFQRFVIYIEEIIS